MLRLRPLLMVLLGIAAFGLTLEHRLRRGDRRSGRGRGPCRSGPGSRWRSRRRRLHGGVLDACLRGPPRPAAAALAGPLSAAHGHLRQSRDRLRRRRHAQEPRLLLHRRVPRHADRRVAGIGPVATVAMLLPLTFNLDPATSMIMLAGIYYGAQYGGSTTAILVNIPANAGGDHAGRLPDGAPRPRRSCTRHRRHRLLRRRHLRRRCWLRCSPPLATIALKFQPAA